MNRAVFTYGTLMFPPVWHAVTGSFAFGQAANLPGFSRLALRDRSYPGLIEDPGGVVKGIVYSDVDEATLSRLDAFEGVEYDRIEVTVETESGPRAAVTYVLASGIRAEVEVAQWRPEEFARHLPGFLEARSSRGPA